MSSAIEIIKSYIELKIFDNKKLDSGAVEYLKTKYPNADIIYNESNRFEQNLKNIFIEVNVEDNINELEKNDIENFIHSVFENTKKFDINAFIEVKKLKFIKNIVDSNDIRKYYESKVYARLERRKELKLNVNKYQKSIKIKLFVESNQNLNLNIIDPSNLKFQDIDIDFKEKKFQIKDNKLKVCAKEKNEINISLKSEKFIENGTWNLKFNQHNKNECCGTSFRAKEKIENDLGDRDFPKAYADSNKFEPVFIIYYYPKYEEQLKTLDNIFKFYKLSDGWELYLYKKIDLRT